MKPAAMEKTDQHQTSDSILDAHLLQKDAVRFGIEPSTDLIRVCEAARQARDVAYCPYSHFRVGCAILTDSHEVVTGANVENASYPVGICAERCALSKAVTSGVKGFLALAIATDISPPASPCGMCRQFIREFCRQDMPIFMLDKDGKHKWATLEKLLPDSFGPDMLGQRAEYR